jgi:hypothetical protein
MNELSHALALLTGGELMTLDPALACAMRPVYLSPLPSRDAVGRMSTWRPKDTLLFALVRTASGTAVYCHEEERVYRASCAASLSSECPAGVAFLCHWCVDSGAEERREPHLLVFDVLHTGCPDPAERGRQLRKLGRHLPLPLCVVQWVGEASHLEGFLPTLPHEVECTVSLGPDPCRLQRHLRVALPAAPRALGAVKCLGALVN